MRLPCFVLTVTIVYLLALLHITDSLHWLSVGLSGARFDNDRPHLNCREFKGLTRRQRNFCRKHIELMTSIRDGVVTGYHECQYQFQKRRWNCTIVDPKTGELFGDVILREGTRESAFLHAITSAGIAYEVTKACSKGSIRNCGCDLTTPPRGGAQPFPPKNPDPNEQFIMRGCSDNVAYGVAISQRFVDAADRLTNNATEIREKGRMLMNLHNNLAGRKLLADSLRKECRCHGLSGGCNIKTCWDSLPKFKEIGHLIKEKFDGAYEVHVVADEGDSKPTLKPNNTQFKRHTRQDLIYMDVSPDFCEADMRRGILGTQGRQCNITSQGVDGCDLLCCNRGYTNHLEEREEECRCKFHYCCEVRCDKCQRREEKHICN